MQQIAVMISAALMFLFAVAAGAASAGAATLRQDVVVSGEQLTLGDLFEGLAAEVAMTTIARAPSTGTHVTLDAGWIGRVARAYGVAWQPDAAEPQIVIRRASGAEQIEIAEAMHAELSAHLSSAAQIEAPAVDPVAGLETSPEPAAPVAEVPAAPQAPSPALIDVPVLAQRIRPGTVITIDDLAWNTVPDDRRLTGAVLDAAELVGMTLRRAIAPGNPIPFNELRPPVVVSRGGGVAMVFRQGPLTLTTRGRALEDGAIGDMIRVLNVDSNRTVDTVVTGPEAVTVRTGTAFARLD